MSLRAVTDAKFTSSFNKAIIDEAKEFVSKNNISLSGHTDFLLSKVTSNNESSLEDLPISDWVSMMMEEQAIYQTKQK